MLVALGVCAAVSAHAQMAVQNSNNPPYDPERLIRDVFLGEGVEVISIQYDGQTEALGYFEGGGASIGLEKGIVMTTGQVESNSFAEGVDANSGLVAQLDNMSTVVDENLRLIEPDRGGAPWVKNIAKYTIKFIPKGNKVKFRYVFASEEYPEFVCSDYRDIFGFFISGPGITGPFLGPNGEAAANIAVVPGSTLPVTINSINGGTPGAQNSGGLCDLADESLAYAGLFIDNDASGGQPVYDGYTTVLTAEADVTACQEYTIQMSIGDVRDASFDSGVFMEAKSFSTPVLKVDVLTQSVAGEIAEGCEPGYVIFKASEPSAVDRSIPITVGGTATPGIDYAAIQNPVIIPAGITEVRVPIDVFVDADVEATETVTVEIEVDECTTKIVEVKIVDRAIPPVPLVLDTTVCAGTSIDLDATLPIAVTNDTTFEHIPASKFVSAVNQPYYYDLEVGGVSSQKLRENVVVSVCLDLTHNRTQDLDIYLFGPSGNYVELTTDNGGDDIGGYQQTCFTSTATNSITDPAFAPPYDGEFLPEGDWSSLYGDGDQDVNGTWQLQIVDDTNSNSGRLNSWSMTFAGAYNVDYDWTNAASLTCSDCPNPTATPTATTVYTITASDSYGCTESADLRIAIATPTVAPVVACAPSLDEVTFSWALDPEVLRYEVSVDGGAYQDIGTVDEYTVTGLNFGVDTELSVRAVGLCNEAIGSATCTTQNCTSYTLNETHVDASCGGYSDGSVTLSPASGTSPYTYTLGARTNTTGTFDSLAAGSYTANVEDANGCGGSVDFIISAPAIVTTNVTVVAPTNCGDDTEATVSVTSGGVAPFSYAWSDGQATATVAFSAAGTYYVVVTDASGCMVQDSAVLTDSAPLTAVFGFSNVSCFSESDGELGATVVGGQAPYTYDIGGAGQAGSLFTGLAAATYTLTVTDALSCTIDTTITLLEPTQLNLSATAEPVTCNSGTDGAAIPTVTGSVYPYAYAWSNGSTDSLLQNVAAGTYTLNLTDAGGCTRSTSVTVSEPGALSVTATAVDAVCNAEPSGSMQASTLGGIAPFSFAWSTGAVTGDSALTALIAGDYTVTVTDANGCTATAAGTVSQPLALQITAVQQPISCDGEANGALEVSVSGGSPGYTYAWNDGPTSQNRSNLSAGTYTLTVTDAAGCTGGQSFTFEAADALTLDISVDSVSCFGYSDGAITTVTTGGRSPYAYEWAGSDGTAFFVASPTDLAAGTYTLAFRDGFGCRFDTSVIVGQPDVITLATTAGDSICFAAANGSAEVSVTGGTSPFAYNWDNGETTATAIALDAGDHTVDVQDAKGCVFEATATIAELPQIVVELTHDSVLCYGDSNGVARVANLSYDGRNADFNAFSYYWNTGPSDTLSVLDSLGGGQSVIVTATDVRGCTGRASVVIIEPKEIEITATKLTDVSCAGATDGSAIGVTTGGAGSYTYNWPASSSSSGSTVTDLPAGEHSVIATDARGCIDSTTVVILAPDSLKVELTTDLVNCFDRRSGKATIAVVGGAVPYRYNWSSGSSTTVADSLAVGDYTVSVVDANGCRVDTIASVATASLVTVDGAAFGVSCFGDRDGAIELDAAGGNGPHTYSINGVPFNQFGDFRYLKPGRYAALAQDRDGCPSDTLYLDVSEPAEMTVDIGEQVAVELGDTVQLGAAVAFAQGDTTFSWRPGTPGLFSCNDCPNPILTPTFAGVVTLSISDGRGCVAEDVLRVRISKVLRVAVPTGFTPNDDGIDDLLLVHGKTGTEVRVFEVFDRWGARVYGGGEFKVNAVNQGWDGIFRGKPAAAGVYLWRAEVRYLDGVVESVSGQTTLIR